MSRGRARGSKAAGGLAQQLPQAAAAGAERAATPPQGQLAHAVDASAAQQQKAGSPAPASQDHDPIVQKAWHTAFELAGLTLAQCLEAAGELADEQARKEVLENGFAVPKVRACGSRQHERAGRCPGTTWDTAAPRQHGGLDLRR